MFLENLDLLSVGIAVAATIVLGFAVYFNNRESVTNKTFLLFSLITASWGAANYGAYQFDSSLIILWLFRLVIFLAVWQTFSLFQFFFVFPLAHTRFPKWYKVVLLPVIIATSITTLTPLVFSGVVEITGGGQPSKTIVESGIYLFGALAVGLVVAGISLSIVKLRRLKGQEKRSLIFILLGTVLMFGLIIVFNFILAGIYLNVKFIPLGALFIFPFVAFTSYAILKHKLFNIRVAGTGVLVFLLAVVTFLEVILAKDLYLILYRSSIFILVLLFGILLIRTVLREVEQRERLQELTVELRAANEKLKVLDKAKTEFVSLGSHQLRSPLTAIKGYTSMILEGTFGEVNDKVKNAINIIFQSSQKLVRVIEDFLNITRIELGTMKYEMRPLDLKQVVETVIKELKPNIEQKKLKINLVAEPRKNYIVTGDSGKISQIVNNLIDNAIKYTEEGSITVELKRRDNKVRLSVSDTGIGIAPEVLPKLFEKFIRANGAGEVNITGAGLGLYVAKQIVEAHGGKIWAESPGVGKGSRFVVEV